MSGWKPAAIAGVGAVLGAPVALGVGLVLIFPVLMGGGAAGGSAAAVSGVDPVMLAAYSAGADGASKAVPSCQGMRWQILAGIAAIESGHAAGRTVAADGAITPPIIGPALDGSGAGGNTTPVRDTDGGRWDGDTVFDHAVGPFQFIPSTWSSVGRDGNGDGKADPNNAFDAAVTAGVYLCGGGRDLRDPAGLSAAIMTYNHSQAYVDLVEAKITQYDTLGSAGPQVAPATSGKCGVVSGPVTSSYPNGQIPLSALCELQTAPGNYLRMDAAYAFDQLSAAYKQRFGHYICVTDSYRTLAEQIVLKAEKGKWAATPGTSNHGWGKATDLGCGIQSFGTVEHQWMITNAGRFGWFHPAWAEPSGSLPEPWHFEFQPLLPTA